MHNLGHTRSVRRPSYLLQTPDTFIRSQIPGSDGAKVVIHASPVIGARFAQYTVEFDSAGGILGDAAGQRFVYVLDGAVSVEAGTSTYQLARDGFAYIPQGMAHQLTAGFAARAAVIEKPYVEATGLQPPEFLTGQEPQIQAQPILGDEALRVRPLLPDSMAFDFSMSTLTYDPGAALPMVEIHIMEHGLLMLEGQGIYRLDDDWHPVTAGDFIWMAPFCPQWFGTLGKVPAKYLLYKDWNRHPLRDR